MKRPQKKGYKLYLTVRARHGIIRLEVVGVAKKVSKDYDALPEDSTPAKEPPKAPAKTPKIGFQVLLDSIEAAVCDVTSPHLHEDLEMVSGVVRAFLEKEDNDYKDKIRLQYAIRSWFDKIVAIEKALGAMHEAAQKKYVPEAMENEGIEKISIAGIGTVYLQSDMYVSMVAERKEEAYKWLEDMGNGDLIKPTVNSSSLSALIKGMVKDGVEVPADLINTTPYTKAVIKTK